MKVKSCTHLDEITKFKSVSCYACAECVKTAVSWIHLKTCQSCGVTLCCDSSPNKHATAHFKTENHLVVSSAEPDENWLWCYTDKLFKSH
ncbi:MAG: UBP-type zinc finger domain-containing protein [Flavobacteriales bacterium]